MKKSIVSLYSLLLFVSVNAGILDTTKVITPHGEKEVRELREGDEICCFNPHGVAEIATVSKIEEVETESIIEITTADDVTLYVAAEQKLFVSYKWVDAISLALEDVLLTSQRTFVGIKSIRHINQHAVLRFIQLDKNHTFFAGDNGVLIHNGPIGATIGVWVGFGLVGGVHALVVGGATTLGTMVGGPKAGVFVGGVVYNWTAAPAAYGAKVAAVYGGAVLGTLTGPV